MAITSREPGGMAAPVRSELIRPLAHASARDSLSRLGENRRGTTSLVFALALVPILVSVGAGVDFTRAITFRTELQDAVDSAALAGAGAYVDAASATTASGIATNYMNQIQAGLPPNNGVTFHVNTNQLTNSSGQTTGYSVSVTATAGVATTLMSIAVPAVTAAVAATALNPVVTYSASLGNWKSSAADANTIYWYVVPANGALPTAADLHQMFTNTGPEPSSIAPITLTASQKIGFALKNVTGGISGYGPNQYGSQQGHTNWLYSQLSPPSAAAYPNEPNNCSLQVAAASASGQVPTETPGSCSSATPALATLNCTQAAGKSVYYFWNDMGGGRDDFDYNDAQYSVTCSNPASGGAVAANTVTPTTVVLTQ